MLGLRKPLDEEVDTDVGQVPAIEGLLRIPGFKEIFERHVGALVVIKQLHVDHLTKLTEHL